MLRLGTCSTPVLTICIPSYNYRQYLPQAIESCLKSQADFRLVVLDNASTDETPELRSRYESDSRITWHRNQELLPIQDNWNKVVSLANTPWVKVLQADDFVLPGAIERFLQMIESKPTAWFHGHLCRVVNGDGKTTRSQRPYTKSGLPMRLEPQTALPLKLRQIARLKEPTCNFFRKEAWILLAGYDKKYRFAFDVAFNVELMAHYEGWLWSEYLGCVRRHVQSDGARLPAALAMDDLRLVVGRILERAPGPGNQRAARAWLQYRLLELILQRLRRRPQECAGVILANFSLILHVTSWFGALATAVRKFRTGDVQKTVP